MKSLWYLCGVLLIIYITGNATESPTSPTELPTTPAPTSPTELPATPAPTSQNTNGTIPSETSDGDQPDDPDLDSGLVDGALTPEVKAFIALFTVIVALMLCCNVAYTKWHRHQRQKTYKPEDNVQLAVTVASDHDLGGKSAGGVSSGSTASRSRQPSTSVGVPATPNEHRQPEHQQQQLPQQQSLAPQTEQHHQPQQQQQAPRKSSGVPKLAGVVDQVAHKKKRGDDEDGSSDDDDDARPSEFLAVRKPDAGFVQLGGGMAPAPTEVVQNRDGRSQSRWAARLQVAYQQQ